MTESYPNVPNCAGVPFAHANLFAAESQMEYRDYYRGHVLNAWTTEVGADECSWAYTIDDEAMVEGPRQQ